MGRPAKFSKYPLILEKIREGNSPSAAASLCGIAPSTLTGWKQADRKFAEQVELAAEMGKKVWTDRQLALYNDPTTPPNVKASILEHVLRNRFHESEKCSINLQAQIIMSVAGVSVTTDELDKFSRMLDPLMKILKDEVQDAETLERISRRIESVYGNGK